MTLDNSVSIEDIKQAVFDLGAKNDIGLDGVPMFLFQKH